MKLTRREVLVGTISAAALTVAGVRLWPDGGQVSGPTTPTPSPSPDTSPGPDLAALEELVRTHGAWVAAAMPDEAPDARQATSLTATYPRPPVGSSVAAVVGCAGRYELRIDGRPAAHGPAPYHHEQAVLDVLDLSALFADDDTDTVAITLHIVDPGLETGITERPREGDDAVTGGHAFLLVSAGDEVWTLTDEQWRVGPSSEWSLDTPPVNHALGWVEHRQDATTKATDAPTVVSAPFPDAVARPRAHAFMPGLAGSTAVLRRPERIVVAGTAPPSMPPVDAITGDLQTAPIEPVERPAADASEWDFSPDGRDLHLLVDLGQVWTGAVHMVVEAANAGAVVDVGSSEDLAEGRLLIDDVASNHAHRFETELVWRMRPSGARYLHIVVRDPGARIRLRDVGLLGAPTPGREGSFECSDPDLTRLWEAGARTIEGAWGDLLVADPAREMRAWVGDLHVGLRTARALSWAAADVEAARFLERVARLRRPDGSLPKYAPGEAPEYSTIPGYVLAWVLALAEHAKVSPTGRELAADLATVRDGALAWFDQWLGDDGLVRDVDGWLFADWTPARLDGTSLYFSALRRQVDLALGRAPVLQPAVAADAFAQDGRAAWRDVVGAPATSQQANAHAVLAGLLGDDDGRAAMDDVISNGVLLDRTVGPGAVADRLDIQRQAVAVQPYQGTFMLDAMAALGMGSAAVEFLRDRWVPLAREAPTLTEFFDTSGSRCHPWSTAPTAWLTRHALGLQLTGPSTARVEVMDLGLHAAAGALPSPHGPVRLEWDTGASGDRRGALDVPDGLVVEVIGPAGPQPAVRGPQRTTVAL